MVEIGETEERMIIDGDYSNIFYQNMITAGLTPIEEWYYEKCTILGYLNHHTMLASNKYHQVQIGAKCAIITTLMVTPLRSA